MTIFENPEAAMAGAYPDRPFRVLLPDGVEQRVSGERIDVFRNGTLVESRRLPWLDRMARQVANAWRRISIS